MRPLKRIAPEWGLAAALLALVGASLAVGAYPVPVAQLPALLASAFDPGLKASPVERTVVLLVRAPRIVLAASAGAALGLAGATLQGLFRNPLVGPDIVGASAGAAFGGAFAILLAWAPALVVASAFTGGLGALALTLAVAALVRSAGALGVVLSGVVVAAFFGAGLTLLEVLADPNSGLQEVVYWLSGSFADADRDRILTLIVTALGPAALVLRLRWRLNLLAASDEGDARVLDPRLAALRWVMLAAAALLVAGQVAVSGVVGWVGLVAPHAARMMVGPDHRRLLPASALAGAVLTLGADALVRLDPVQEPPVGVLAALAGAPVFVLLFWRTQGRGWARG